MPTKRKWRVLVVFANPRGSSSLRLGEEDRAISQSIQLSKHRDRIHLEKRQAATVHDLSRALLDQDYDIVHVSGHGTQAGLVLEKDDGSCYVVPKLALAETFSSYAHPKGPVRCVILNACYSVSTGTLASLGVPQTIVMEGAISDQAAIEFSRGFYDAIGAGKEIEFAYGEGCRRVKLAAPGSQFVSKLLPLGQTYVAATPQASNASPAQPLRGDESPEQISLLLGLAVDLSGSMRDSIRNNSGGAMTRLEGFRRSLDRVIGDTVSALKSNNGSGPLVRLFAYGFGFSRKSIRFADLLSLVRVSNDLITSSEIERLKQKHTEAVRRKYEGMAGKYGDVGNLLRPFFPAVVEGLAQGARERAEAEIKELVVSDITATISDALKELGDSTLTIQEVADLWQQSGGALQNADQLIFGETPMCAALRAVKERFDVELQRSPRNTLATLFLLSDGIPTDGSPQDASKIVQSIGELGVSVASCFVTNHDVADPRTLYGQPLDAWESGARLMFDGASKLPHQSELAHFLLKKGWVIQPDARLFVQLNHADVLNEFMDVLLLPARRGEFEPSLPLGETSRNP
jgi:hypothetical protein